MKLIKSQTIKMYERIKLFESKKIRSVWNDDEEKWYFSVQDVVEILTDSADIKQYIKKLKAATHNCLPLGYNLYPGWNDRSRR